MPLHVALRDLHREGDLAARLDSRYLPALRLGDHLGVVNEEACAFSEPAEELKAAIVLDRREHTDSFLDDARLDGHMSAPVRLYIFVAVRVEVGAVYDDLGPAVWVH